MQKRHTTCRNSLARSVFVAISCLMTVMIAAAADETAVRDLPIEIVTKLAAEIYRQDTYAAEATDLLLQGPGGPSALEREGVRGLWVVTGNDREVIRFVREAPDGFTAAYDVTFLPDQRPVVSRVKNPRLSEAELAQLRARQLARRQVSQPCAQQYNTVALPDGSSGNLLIYALAATDDPNLVLIGGHYRITVSGDGRSVRLVEKLSKSCLALKKNEVPRGGKLSALLATHVVSEFPLETHGYLSLLHKQPLYIRTKKGMWKVDAGEFTLVEQR